MAAGRDKLDFIDRLKGLGIVVVIAVHYGQVFATPAIRTLTSVGQVGVQMFFFASAFTLCLSTHHRPAERHPLANFWIRRITRIAPIYYLGIAAYAAMFIAGGEGANYTAGNILANALLIHGLVPAANNTIVPGGWTIGAEMLFYAVFPWLFAAIERRWRQRGNAALAAPLIASLALALAWALGMRWWSGSWIANNQFGYCAFPAQAPVFLLGMAWYFAVWCGGALPPRPGRDAALAAALFGLTSAIIGIGVRPLYAAVPTIAALGTVFLANRLRAAPHPGSRLGAIGRVSYSLYILHFALVWRPSAWLLHARFATPAREWAVALPLYLADLALLWLAARITSRWIEAPANRLAQRLIRNLENSAKTE